MAERTLIWHRPKESKGMKQQVEATLNGNNPQLSLFLPSVRQGQFLLLTDFSALFLLKMQEASPFPPYQASHLFLSLRIL